MGSISAMNSIDRVLEKHGKEIQQEYAALVPELVKPIFDHVDLENAVYVVKVTWVFKDGSTLEGPTIDIDDLGQEYPDCEVGY